MSATIGGGVEDTDRVIATRYRLVGQIGAGAMGVVWRAEDERLGRVVALKQVSLRTTGPDPETVAREQAHRRVMREGRMIARLHHPNAIAVYDVVEHDDEPWLVMEYLDSASLAATLEAEGTLPPARVARVGGQVAAALAAAHEAGIVHRDVKPGNVLLGEGGLTKVTDFGIARAVDEATLTSSGMMAGTPAYLSPEVARGGTADFRSDVFALGSTLSAALEGAPPFGTGDNPLALLHRVASGRHTPARRAGPLTPLLASLLDPDPDRRPPMSHVHDQLSRLAATEAETGSGPLPPVAPMTPMSPMSPMSPMTPMTPKATAIPPTPVPVPTRPVGPPDASAPRTGPATTSPVRTSPVDAPPDDGARPRRRRHPLLVAAAGIAALTLVGVVIAMLAAGGPSTRSGTVGTDPSSAADPSSSATGRAVGAGGPVGAGSDAADPAPAIQGSDPTLRAQQQTVADYYGLLPDRLDDGWQRLTPSYQRTTAGGIAGYRGFWSAISTVAVREMASGPNDSVDATVTYGYRDGRTVVERTQFRMAEQDGAWKIDGSTVLSSR